MQKNNNIFASIDLVQRHNWRQVLKGSSNKKCRDARSRKLKERPQDDM